MLTYRMLNKPEIIRYIDSDFIGYQDSTKSISGYVYIFFRDVIS